MNEIEKHFLKKIITILIHYDINKIVFHHFHIIVLILKDTDIGNDDN